MAQKDKIKELVGRGLHSYHTKSLQQIDRIEKKNKEQNHKISILSNELDNDYLTKIEEGSVVSLEHSKEGMIYLDELQGNTLVNYCTDGSKEITLNGDIDVEGTFVTTTEGVDNGKVDVMCEGNTLVNLVNHPNSFTVTRTEGQTYRSYDVPILYSLKANTTYTIYLTVESNEFDHNPFTSIVIGQGNGDSWSNRVFWNKEFGKDNTDKGLGRNKAIFTTHSRVEETSFKWIKFIFESYSEYNTTIKDIVLLEGEHNEDIDNFIGMKSVGQDDENGHKIEILSSNGKPNLFRNSGFLNGLSGFSFHNQSRGTIIEDATSGSGKILKVVAGENSNSGFYQANLVPHIENTKYTLSCYCKGDINSILDLHIERHKHTRVQFTNNDWVRVELTSELNPTNWNRTITFYSQTPNATFYVKDIKIEVSDYATPYIPHTTETNYNTFKRLNKKEILLNEPLRGLPNGVKDKKVKIGNKWYIERNCAEYDIADVSGNEWAIETNSLGSFLNGNSSKYKHKPNSECICDKLPSTSISSAFVPDFNAITSNLGGENQWRIKITSCETKEDYVEWVSKNPLKVVIEKYTPTYEPLLTVPELECYNDVTHISNNSIIPCNMKIQNSGYNAIIKPSTLYTVALYTNKSGTIGMNLGGVKGTTTNNVLTLTTPATLTDDSLRLYGKGIKGSKVRLLEGDKTNWIPSFFEGMKSSFEDKFDATDNTYKMEILSNNKNVLDLSKHNGVTTYTHHGVTFSYDDKTQEFTVNGTATQDLGYQPLLYSNDRFLVFKQNKQYTISTTTLIPFTVQISQRNVVSALTLHPNSKFKNRFDRADVNYCNTKMDYFMLWGISKGDTFNNLKFKLQIEEGDSNTEYIPHKSNKIQFSSIEPLRSVGNTKDKFVFKNNKLMIERNIGEITIKDTILSTSKSSDTNRTYTTRFILDKKLFPNIKLQTGNTFKSDRFKHTSWSLDVEGFGIGSNLDFNILNIRLSSLDVKGLAEWFKNNPTKFAYILAEPTYEEIPFELQKIILEGYENGTLFFDTNIPPTSTVTYAGETPIVKSVKLNKTEVLNNTTDINDNIIPYLMDMDYRVVCLELATETQGISMARLFGGVYEMLKRDILSGRLSKEEYGYRLADYFNAGKLTEEQVRELEDLR